MAQQGYRTDQVEGFVASNLRRNFAALALDFGFFGLGLSISSTATVLPALAERLGASNLVLGAIPSLMLLGRAAPALFSARHIETLPRKLPFVLTYTLWERVPWLALALALFALGSLYPDLVLALLVLHLAGVAVVGGSLSPAWTGLVGKVIPTSYRGRFFAIGSGFSTGLGLLGALASGYLLRDYPFPVGYTLCLAATFLCLMASFAAMAAAREPEEKVTRQPLRMGAHLRRLPGIVRANRSYGWYLVARALTVTGMMAVAFYTVQALRELGAAEWNVGGFTFALLAAQAGGGLALGFLADRFGHRVSLLVGSFAAVGANLMALTVTNLGLYHGVFLLLGVSLASTTVSSSTFVLELVDAEERATCLGLATTAQGPFALVGPPIAAVLAAWMGLGAVFVASGLLSVGAAVVYMVRVEEPRGR